MRSCKSDLLTAKPRYHSTWCTCLIYVKCIVYHSIWRHLMNFIISNSSFWITRACIGYTRSALLPRHSLLMRCAQLHQQPPFPFSILQPGCAHSTMPHCYKLEAPENTKLPPPPTKAHQAQLPLHAPRIHQNNFMRQTHQHTYTLASSRNFRFRMHYSSFGRAVQRINLPWETNLNKRPV